MLARKPRAVANQVNVLLNTVLGTERFPLDVKSVAMELSKQWSPAAPITKIEGHAGVEGFEGALQRNPDAKRWRILYSKDREPARQRFTIAHELGHFALHRELQSDFQCSTDDVSGQSERDMEKEADQFASTLLMPLDDLRTQMRAQPFGFDLIKHCADRYGVSLTATARQCAEICEQRVVVAVTRDDGVIRAWASTSAYRSGLYLPTRKHCVEVPAASIAHSARCNQQGGTATVPAMEWFPNESRDTPLTEHTLYSPTNESTLMLLVLPKVERRFAVADPNDEDQLVSTDARFRRMGRT